MFRDTIVKYKKVAAGIGAVLIGGIAVLTYNGKVVIPKPTKNHPDAAAIAEETIVIRIKMETITKNGEPAGAIEESYTVNNVTPAEWNRIKRSLIHLLKIRNAIQ